MKITKKATMDYLTIILGAFLLGFAIMAFWVPHNMVTGGISGLAMIIFHYTEMAAGFEFPIPIWLTNLVLNFPLFVLGYKIMPREYFPRSICGYISLTAALNVFQFLPEIPSDPVSATVFGGVVAGVGMSLILRLRATTGGSTLIAAILQRWVFPHISLAKVLFGVDTAIVLLGLYAFGLIPAMYAVMAIYVATKVTDAIVEGLKFSKAAFVISQKADEIGNKIIEQMDRGVTEIFSRGKFTKKDQNLLLCVVPAKEMVALKELVYAIDEDAFVIVTDVREVLGNGFQPGKV